MTVLDTKGKVKKDSYIHLFINPFEGVLTDFDKASAKNKCFMLIGFNDKSFIEVPKEDFKKFVMSYKGDKNGIKINARL